MRNSVDRVAHQCAQHVTELPSGEVGVAHHDHAHSLGMCASNQLRDRFKDESVGDFAGNFCVYRFDNPLRVGMGQQLAVDFFQRHLAGSAQQEVFAAQIGFSFGSQGRGDSSRTERLQRLQVEEHIGWPSHFAPQEGVEAIE